MHSQLRRTRVVMLLLGFAAFALTGWASADPPERVARLGYTSGAVSFSPAGDDDWVEATMNRPLIAGDRLWADAEARSELQVGSAVIRIGGGTSLTILNLDDRVTQLQVAQGRLNVRVRQLEPDEIFEVDTPNLAFSIRRPGRYRIDVDPDDDTTSVVVRRGQGEVYGEDAAFLIDARQSYRFAGVGLRDYEYAELPPRDEFDRWCSERDRRLDDSISARYVSPEVIGYEDLDQQGTWRFAEGYGNVWVPTRVAAGWAPYRDGHWAWIEPWGWTWVDDAPWGFAVSHYGRWTHVGETWAWVPGPIAARAVYAPALVAFVGVGNLRLALSSGDVGAVAWFPIGPHEVYRPAYPVSRDYFARVNTSNTIINNTTITNVYNNTNVTRVTYANRDVPGAIVAVPKSAFVESRPIARAAVRLSRDALIHEPVTAVAAVAPLRTSVSGAARPGRKPPAGVLARPILAKAPPPPMPVPFAARQPRLAANPGRPLDAATLKALEPAAPTHAAKIRLLAPTRAAVPVAPPPIQRGQPERRGAFEQRTQPPSRGAQPQTIAPPPAESSTEARGRFEQRSRPEQRGGPPQTVAPAPAESPEQRGRFEQRTGPVPRGGPPQSAAPAPAESPEQRGRFEQRGQPAAPGARPQTVAPAPAESPPEQRGRFEQRGQPEQRGGPPQTVAPAPAEPPREQRGRFEQRGQPAAPDARPQSAPPAPAESPPEQRGRFEQRTGPAPRGGPPQTVAPAPAEPPREQRGRLEQRSQPAAPGARPQSGPPAPAESPPEQRGRFERRSEPEQRGQPEPRARPEQPAAARPVTPPRPASNAPRPPPEAEQPSREAKPAAAKPEDKRGEKRQEKKGDEQRKREEEDSQRKP